MAPKRFIPIDYVKHSKRGHHGRLRDSKGLFLANTTPKPVVKEKGVYPKGYRYRLRDKDGRLTSEWGTIGEHPEGSGN